MDHRGHSFEQSSNHFLSFFDKQMQDCGQPPADILDELAPGLEMGADGAPKMPDMPECNMQ